MRDVSEQACDGIPVGGAFPPYAPLTVHAQAVLGTQPGTVSTPAGHVGEAFSHVGVAVPPRPKPGLAQVHQHLTDIADEIALHYWPLSLPEDSKYYARARNYEQVDRFGNPLPRRQPRNGHSKRVDAATGDNYTGGPADRARYATTVAAADPSLRAADRATPLPAVVNEVMAWEDADPSYNRILDTPRFVPQRLTAPHPETLETSYETPPDPTVELVPALAAGEDFTPIVDSFGNTLEHGPDGCLRGTPAGDATLPMSALTPQPGDLVTHENLPAMRSYPQGVDANGIETTSGVLENATDRSRYRHEARRAKEIIAANLHHVTEALIKRAVGCKRVRTTRDGVEEVYDELPDVHAAEILLNRLMGKPVEFKEVEETTRSQTVHIFIPHNDRGSLPPSALGVPAGRALPASPNELPADSAPRTGFGATSGRRSIAELAGVHEVLPDVEIDHGPSELETNTPPAALPTPTSLAARDAILSALGLPARA